MMNFVHTSPESWSLLTNCFRFASLANLPREVDELDQDPDKEYLLGRLQLDCLPVYPYGSFFNACPLSVLMSDKIRNLVLFWVVLSLSFTWPIENAVGQTNPPTNNTIRVRGC